MDKGEIKVGHTYTTDNHRVMYVHELTGQKVTFCYVGSMDRIESSLGRFASRVTAEITNQ